MSKTATLTIVLATANQLARADFDDSTEHGPVRFWRAPRRTGSRTPEAVQAALALGGKAMRRVVVLSEDFWAQSMVLISAQASGLAPDELAQALGFEIEPFSNVAPHESALGYCATVQEGSTTAYWVVETSRSELATLRDIVASAGGRLAHASHPGGLPAPLGRNAPAASWQRLEAWHQCVIHASSTAPGAVQIQRVNSSQWETERTAPSDYGEVLAEAAEGTASAGLAPPEWPRFNLAEDAGLQHWLQAWAKCLESDPRRLALMTPLPSPTPPRLYVATGALLACATAMLSLAHGSWFARQRNTARRDLATIEASVSQIVAIEQENNNLRRSVSELSQSNRARADAARTTAVHRRALPALLHALGSVRSPGVVLQRIGDEGGNVLRVTGLSLTVGAVDDLLTRLAQPLQDAGWTVKQVRKEARQLLDDGGPWCFTLRLSLSTPLSGAPGQATVDAEPPQGVAP